MTRRISQRRVWIVVVWTAITMIISMRSNLAAEEPKTVLILQSYGQNFKPWSEYSRTLRQELERRSPGRLIVQDFSVITAGLEERSSENQFVDYLRALFANRSPDLIVTFGAPGAIFAQNHRTELFPGVPLVFAAIEERLAKSMALTENDTVVSVRQNIPVLFGHILQVLPHTKTVAVVIGDSPPERFWKEQIQRELAPLKDQAKLLFYNDLSFDEILKQASSLPPDSALFWVQPKVDVRGAANEGDRALRALARVANAPIFSFDDAFLSGEIVGGPMISVSVTSQTTTDVALRILSGEKPATITTPVLQYGPAKYDWRQLQRWGIGEDKLAPGSEIHFREPSLWDRYHWQIVAFVALVFAQAALIGLLVNERRRRLYFEVQASRRSAELAHFNRYSTAGELTASIAHELNQPLGAILINAELAEILLNASSPDLDQLREIVGDIRRDDQRASTVLQHLRELLKKAPPQIKDVDLNEIAGESVELLSSLSIARQVKLSAVTTSTSLPIGADRVQLQQALVNLIVNAMDALSNMPSSQRGITIHTERADNCAELSVSDTGPGVPPEKTREVFEPFFTTKAQGMGIGLSIARRIVEAHNGRIWAENRAGGGAVFRISLPLSAAHVPA
jgi:signal transduction histidine kinase